MNIRMEAIPRPDGLKDVLPAAQGVSVLAHAELEGEGPSRLQHARHKQTVLVTGHAGFIGFHVVKALLERGDTVIGFDSLNTHYDTRLKRERLAMLGVLSKQIGATYQAVKADLCDSKALHTCLAELKVQRVIHLAGQTDKYLSSEKPMECVRNNVNAFLVLLEACRHFNVDHFTYASSHAVYGAGFQKPITEKDSANHPQRLDAATQRSCELIAHSYSHQFRLPTTGLRFFSVYGPWGRPDSVLFAFARRILDGKPIQIYNDGSNTRDYTYIDDLVEGVLRASDAPAQSNPSWLAELPDQASSNAPWRVLNIGNGQPVSIEELIGALEQALGKPAVKEFITGPILEKSQSCADVSALMDATAFRPNTQLAHGINRFVQWYRGYYKV